MNKKIILNWLPPANTAWPSPAMSVLKKFLCDKGNYEVHILYWNIILRELQNEYAFGEIPEVDNEIVDLSIFYAYIAYIENDETYLLRQEALLHSLKPQYYNSDKHFYRKHIVEKVCKLDDILRNELSNIQVQDCLFFGMSLTLYQWIPAMILARIVKEINPAIKIVVGGIGNKTAAVAYLNSIPEFDYALWGEGEFSLLEFSHTIQKKYNHGDLYKIPHIAFRDADRIVTSDAKAQYANMDTETKYDFSDFIKFTKESVDKISFPIEASRGCHWRQCRFCYLNEGYKYRSRNPESIVDDIYRIIKEYGSYSFHFLDNDIIGRDLNNFEKLLDMLIELRNEYPKFNIILAEVITKNISANLIKKMSLAGFTHTQIGYESPSAELLKKIHKKNTFASNLLFVKWAAIYYIRVNGANVIRGMLEETDQDIHESINNLHFLRFTLKENYFQHNISHLAVCDSSRYFKELKEANKLNDYHNSFDFFMSTVRLKDDDKYSILHYIRSEQNMLWDFFQKIESYYLDNLFEYSIQQLDDKIFYREYCNKEEINVLQFEETSLHWQILCICNEKVASISDLNCLGINTDEVSQAIDELVEEGILYASIDKQEMVGVINTDTRI